jgi:hypothetical protein
MLGVSYAFRDLIESTIALKDRVGELEEFSRLVVDYLDPAGRQGMCNIECPAYSMCAGKKYCMFEHWAIERARELGLYGEERS